jgi:nucleotide-binding universal stress UspA family protein
METGQRPQLRIFHPSDLAPDGAGAFHHALAIAWRTRSRLTIMHVPGSDRVLREELPGVRATLNTWGWTRLGNELEQLRTRGVTVRKVLSGGGDPVAACIRHLDAHPADLVVLHTSQHGGRMRWQERSVSEEVRRGVALPTLFLPAGRRGWVDPMTGRRQPFRRVVVGIDRAEDDRVLVDALGRLPFDVTGPGVITRVHAGDRLEVEPFARQGISLVEGPVVDALVHASRDADLLVLGTRGPQGLFDALRGTTTEQVLRRSGCPLLSLPLGDAGG